MIRLGILAFAFVLALSLLARAADEAAWTLLFYISGETGHSRELAEELRATHETIVRECAANERINVVTLYDPLGSGSPAVFQVFTQGRPRPDLRREYRELNMGAEWTLLNEFLRPCLSAAPAGKHALFILGHGSGWWPARRPSGASPDAGFLAADASHGDDGLTPSELRDALAAAASLLPSGKFDLIAFHACDMSCFELGYQLRHVAQLMLAPESLLPKQGLSYSSLSRLTAETSARELAARIVADTERASRESALRPQLTLCDLSAAKSVAEALDDFVAACTAGLSAPNRPLTLEDCYEWPRSPSTRPYDTDVVKLMDFVARSYPEHPQLQSAARQVSAALERYCVTSGARPTAGLSIMFLNERTLKSLARDADTPAATALERYRALDFARESKWLSLVEALLQAQRSRLRHGPH
ncbi:MAG: hypothetical protein FJ272_20840 [Planctomycetes bacterium]|nr:hypothetical protein [Planctomycetota bacterium]